MTWAPATIRPRPKRPRRYRQTKEWRQAVESDASVFVVQLGTNDAMLERWNETQFEIALRGMLEHLGNLPQRPKVIASVPPPFVDGFDYAHAHLWGAASSSFVNDAMPAVVRRVAAAGGWALADAREKFLADPNEFLSDGVHPTRAGYGLVADAVYESLEQALSEDWTSSPSYAPPRGYEPAATPRPGCSAATWNFGRDAAAMAPSGTRRPRVRRRNRRRRQSRPPRHR